MEEKEICLRDYVMTLIKHKWIVILVPVISVITTAIFVLGFAKSKPQPRIYEATLTIQNGFLGKSILEKQEGFEIMKASAGNLGKEIQFEDTTNTPYFRIKLKGVDPDLIKKTYERLAKDYVDSGNSLYNKQYQIYQDKINILNQKKQILEGNISDTQNTISGLAGVKELTKLQIFDRTLDYKNRIANYNIRILDIENSIVDINNILINSKQFAIVAPVTLSDCTGSPKFDKKAKLLISAVMGLAGGILLAFVTENWSKL